MTTSVNQTIEITALGFNNQPRLGRLQSFPRRMVWEDREYTFVESGLQVLVKKGQDLVRLFDVTDGQRSFRLRCENDQQWTLVSTRTAV